MLCLILEIIGITLIFTDENLIRKSVESQWDNLSEEQQMQYEDDNDCDGFDDCYDSLESGLKSNLHIIGGITIGIFVYQLMMTIMSCCLCRLGRKDHMRSDEQ